jgi:hypothetical protein
MVARIRTSPTRPMGVVMTRDAVRGAIGSSGLSRRGLLRGGVVAGASVLAIGAGLAVASEASAATWIFQAGWRWCAKCKGLFYRLNGTTGRCPGGGGHDESVSSHYAIWGLEPGAPDSPTPVFQPGWRWCSKCQGLAFGGNGAPGWCPAGQRHNHAGSLNYHIFHDVQPIPFEQVDWRWCSQCQGLFYGPHQGSSWCPVNRGTRHVIGSVWSYMLQYPPGAGIAATQIREPGS